MIIATYKIRDEVIVIRRRTWRARLLTRPWKPWLAYTVIVGNGHSPGA